MTPFSRSRSMLSSTCSVMSRSEMAPVNCNRRSASVDLPWSTWAMMQKLRMWSVILLSGGESFVDGYWYLAGLIYFDKKLTQYHVSGGSITHFGRDETRAAKTVSISKIQTTTSAEKQKTIPKRNRFLFEPPISFFILDTAVYR